MLLGRILGRIKIYNIYINTNIVMFRIIIIIISERTLNSYSICFKEYNYILVGLWDVNITS